MNRCGFLIIALVVVLLSGCGGGGPSASSLIATRAQSIHDSESIGEVLGHFSNPVVLKYDIVIGEYADAEQFAMTHQDLVSEFSNGVANTGSQIWQGDLVITTSESNGTSTRAFSFTNFEFFDGIFFDGFGSFQMQWTNTSGEWKVHTIIVALDMVEVFRSP